MNKLGYKQKGIPMLKSPLNIEGVTGVTGFKGTRRKRSDTKKGRNQGVSAEPAPVSDFDRYGTQTKASQNLKGKFEGEGAGDRFNKFSSFNPNPTKSSTRNDLASGVQGPKTRVNQMLTNAEKNAKQTPSAGKTILDSANNNFSNKSTKSAANPTKTKETTKKTTNKTNTTNNKSTSTYKSVSDRIKNDTTSTNLTSKGIASNFDRFTKSKQPKIDTVSTTPPNTKTNNTKPAKIKSNKDIRKEKRANIKGGMSRQEARLKKTQSKAASAKAKTNRTIKSIDPTKAKSADTGAKQTSAKSTRAKAKRLEKRAERLKGRVNASKVSK